MNATVVNRILFLTHALISMSVTITIGLTAYSATAHPEVFPFHTAEVHTTQGLPSTGNFNETATLDIDQIETGTDCPNTFWDEEAGEFWCETKPGEWTPPVNWDGETKTTPFDCDEAMTTETEDGVTYSFCDG